MSKAREAIDLNESLHEYPTWKPGSAKLFASEIVEADFNSAHADGGPRSGVCAC